MYGWKACKDDNTAACGRAWEPEADSQHRAVPLPDLLIAACAEQADLKVLHHDADFDRIGELTGQPTQWIVPRGNVS